MVLPSHLVYCGCNGISATSPLWYALLFSVIAAILIHELQARQILERCVNSNLPNRDASPGLSCTQSRGTGTDHRYEGYLFGSLLLMDRDSRIWLQHCVC